MYIKWVSLEEDIINVNPHLCSWKVDAVEILSAKTVCDGTAAEDGQSGKGSIVSLWSEGKEQLEDGETGTEQNMLATFSGAKYLPVVDWV